MPEGEMPETTDAKSKDDVIRDLKAQVRDLNAEARDHRLERNDARKIARELEVQLTDLRKTMKEGGAPSEDMEALRRENRQLKHRGVFDRVARESGARTSGKALDALWDALKYEGDKDADPADLKARIEAVRPDYDFLFDAAPAEGETPTPAAKPEARTTPAKPAGPGAGRGGPADGTGTLRVRKSDFQSFDPRVNPMLDRHRAAEVKKAQAEGRLSYIDE